MNGDADTDQAVMWHLGDSMSHSCFLDTVTNIRPFGHCVFDMVLLLLIICFVLNGLHTLANAGYITNIHESHVNAKWDFIID